MRRNELLHKRRATGAVALAVVAVVALLWAAAHAGTFLVVDRDQRHPDAVIVLASHEWERLPAAARLAMRERDTVVLLTEPGHVTPMNCHRCDERVEWLHSLGVPPERVVRLPMRVNNTYEEALAAYDYSRAHGVRSLTIVTSPYHTRRALATFSRVFGSARSIGVHPALPESQAAPTRWWQHPYDRWYVFYESAALGWYLVRHGVNPAVQLF